jgi:hypothetical protein
MTEPIDKVSIEIKVDAQADTASGEAADKIASDPRLEQSTQKREKQPRSTDRSNFQPLTPWCQNTNFYLMAALILDIVCWISPITPLRPYGMLYLFAVINSFMGAAMLVKMLGVAHDNLESRGVRGLKFNGPGVIYAWFIPILNLYYPFAVMLEIWRGSDVRTHDIKAQPYNASARPVLRWWIATLVGYVFCWAPIAFNFALTPHFSLYFSLRHFTLWPTPATVPMLLFWCVIVCCRIIAVFQLRYLLREITHQQMHRFGGEQKGSPANNG